MAAADALDFQKIISDARERKRNEALAARIFSRYRNRSSLPSLKAAPSGSLASRVGVKKHRTSDTVVRKTSGSRQGNVNREWTHDLHDSINSSPLPLSSRARLPDTKPQVATKNMASGGGPRASLRAPVAHAMDLDPDHDHDDGSSPRDSIGISIRGLAGPFAVIGQNFAPGTTAADIESAMAPIGGDMVSCKITKTRPFLVVEMLFASREGGQRVIDTFDNKTADGRILKVYSKTGNHHQASASSHTSSTSTHEPISTRTTRGRDNTRDYLVDGRMGFSEDLRGSDIAPHTPSRLHGDKMVAGNWRRGGGTR